MFIILLVLARDFVPFVFTRASISPTSEFNRLRSPEFIIDKNIDYKAKVTTNKGTFLIDLFEKNAPLNVNNFIFLAKKNFYTGVRFHRIIPSLLIQTGDRNTLSSNKDSYGFGHPGYFIEDEVNWDSINLDQDRRSVLQSRGFRSNPSVNSIKLDRFVVAIANGGPDTNGSQFFIVTSEFNDSRLKDLQGEFTVIGRVIDGFETVININNIQISNNFPTEDVIIQKIEIQ